MSHWGIGKKIMAGFALVLLLMLVVGGIAYWGLSSASSGFTEYREMARDANLAGELQANMLMVRMNVKDFLISGSQKDIDQYQEYLEQMNGFLETAQMEIKDPERARLIEEIDDALKEYSASFEKVALLMKERNRLVHEVLDIKGPALEASLTDIMTSADEDQVTAGAFHGGLALKRLLLARLYTVKFLDSNDAKTVDRVSEEFSKMQAQLDTLKKELRNPTRRKLLEDVSEGKQIYAKAFSELVNVINERNTIISGTLDRIGPEVAAGVEHVKKDIKGVQDTLGPELVANNNRAVTLMIIISAAALVLGIFLAVVITRGITGPLNRTIEGLSSGAEQVASASEQVSASSQSLAEGASEQAAAIEETSASLEEMAAMTKQNADNAGQANAIMKTTDKDVNAATTAMTDLTASMQAINDASEETQKIVKTIDEIAFQTNLLALNAAVEAARAGEAGAGFAVVADEVRNLAMRAAEAAKTTAGLIEGTVKKVGDGSDLVSRTGEAFSQVAAGSAKIGDLVAEIAAASTEQAQGIEQVNRAASEMDKVTQQNAANAEESASASEELTSQAEQMNAYVQELLSLVDGGGRRGMDGAPMGRPKLVKKVVGQAIAGQVAHRASRNDAVIPLEDDEVLKAF